MNASPTPQVIASALAHARAGRPEAACQAVEAALAEGGEQGPLQALLGMLRCRMGDLAEGSRILRLAHEAQPGDVTIACNLIAAYLDQSRHEEALEVATAEMAASDDSLRVARYRAFLLLTLERWEEAVEAYAYVLAKAPNDFESLNNLGNAQTSAGDAEGGIKSLELAMKLDPSSAPTRLNLATAFTSAGRLDDAAEALRAAAADFPDDSKPMLELSRVLKRQGHAADALAALEQAAERAPGDAQLQVTAGNEQGLARKIPEAIASFRRALAADPANADAFVGLAVVFEHDNRPEDLASLAAEAEATGVQSDHLELIRAMVCRRSREPEAGLEALSRMDPEVEPLRRAHLEGQLLDAVGRTDEAFAAFERMNALQAEDPSDPLRRGADYRGRLREQLSAITPEWAAGWHKTSVPEPDPRVAFLVGFPRSGTTLLDTMLMGHPAASVLEEQPFLAEAEGALGGFAALAAPDADKLDAARAHYADRVRAHPDYRPGNLIVDKNPLSMNKVAAMARLFPGSKVVLALRHPCDVVLSCFMANFRPNSGMSNFLRLEDAAELYDLSFGLFERAAEQLGVDVHRIAYEDMVEDPEGQLRPLVDFVGLEWDDAVLDHQSTAAQRGFIATASYAQVQEPIYKRAVGRWERYRKHLEPVFPTLEPWAEKFGYSL